MPLYLDTGVDSFRTSNSHLYMFLGADALWQDRVGQRRRVHSKDMPDYHSSRQTPGRLDCKLCLN